jgi:LemA protein
MDWTTEMRRKLSLMLLAAFAAAAVAGGVRYLAIRDSLYNQRQTIQDRWARVEEALDERAAALPALMEATGAFPADSPLAGELARAHANLQAARGPSRKVRANREVSQVLAKVLLQADTDRKVRNSAALRTLRESMAGSDDTIARLRAEYNDALEHYNAQLQRFPDNVVALIAGYSRDDGYFGTGPDAPGAPNQLH